MRRAGASYKRMACVSPQSGQRNTLLATAAALLVAAAGTMGGCRSEGPAHPVTAAVSIPVPLGLPPLAIPAGDPPTAASIKLGRELFYEKRLSKNDSISCASCHNPALAFTDGRRVSSGAGGVSGVRNAPTLLNAAYFGVLFWDGRATTLEEQAGDPIANPIEMNQAHPVSVSKIAALKYRGEMNAAFGPGKVTIEKMEMALASFERTLLSGDSAFDRYEYRGDKPAMSPEAVRGLEIFKDQNRGNCVACHSMGVHDALFTDGQFHNIGVGYEGDAGFTDVGRYEQTHREADRGAFRTPSLRNVALTAPYMHDGSLRTLSAVVDFYAGGGNSNSGLDPNIKTIKLSGRDRADLVAFLESLTGTMPIDVGPPTTSVAAR